MKKENSTPHRIRTITELHGLLGLPHPRHPLISIIDNGQLSVDTHSLPKTMLFDFYKISYKKAAHGRMRYGQGFYDFNEGGMVFTAPHQLISLVEDEAYSGFSLVFHSDFLSGFSLGTRIKQFGFFSYETNEALELSEDERIKMLELFGNLRLEIAADMDTYSQDVVVSYMELLVSFSDRYYRRQFATRKVRHADILLQMEAILENYFQLNTGLMNGLPTVEYLAEQLHFSPRYLSDMLRALTGMGAQLHIQEKIIAKAKDYLATTRMSVSEIAYQLGFEHPQSFNKLFRKKTRASPLGYRQLFL